MEGVGGVWVYDFDVENDDLLGICNYWKCVYLSMYVFLCINLFCEIMGFIDFFFFLREGGDFWWFLGYVEVVLYLYDFVEFYGILNFVEFFIVVEYVGLCRNGSKVFWKVRIRWRDGVKEEVFDVVVVCNGYYFEFKFVEILGIFMFDLFFFKVNLLIVDVF